MTVAPTLVAGVGNVLLRDDGFGVEVVRRLAQRQLPGDVSVMDAGIRGLHLALELLDRRELLVIVDALSCGGPPGTLYLVEPDVDTEPGPARPASDRTAAGPGRHRGAFSTAAIDSGGHGMDLPAVFSAVRAMGGTLPPILIIGCEPADVGEGMGLSPAVAGAVDGAVEMVWQQLASRRAAGARTFMRTGARTKATKKEVGRS